MIDDDVSLEAVKDAGWLAGFIEEYWGAPGVVSRGRLWSADELTAIRAVDGDETVGVIAWAPERQAWQIVVLHSVRRQRGIGTRLIETVAELARRVGHPRLWLITTNDNLDALRFYQRRGYRIVAVYPDAVTESRRLKPAIPDIGAYGIPLRDEIELEYIP